MAVRLQALLALVLIHLKTTFLFQVAHGNFSLGVEEGKESLKQLGRTSVKRNFRSIKLQT